LLLHSLTARALEPADTIYKKKPKVEANTFKERMFTPPLVLKTSPTALLWGGVFPYTAEYRFMMEITSGRTSSQQLAVSYLGRNLFLTPLLKAAGINDVYKVNGWRVQYALKLFWIGRKKHAPYGFYVGPLVSYANARMAIGLNNYYRQAYYDCRNFNINGIIGVQAGKMDRVTIDFYAGLGYKNNKMFYHHSSYKITPYDTKDFGAMYNSHLNGVFGINIGYSF